jgi:hypothetical protein
LLTLVTHTKTSRVVYFTADPGYAPAADSPDVWVVKYDGPVPEGLDLSNCWSWRLLDGELRYAPGPAGGPGEAERNRAALKEEVARLADRAAARLLPASAVEGAARAARERMADEHARSGQAPDLLALDARGRRLSPEELATAVRAERADREARLLALDRARLELFSKADLAGTAAEMEAVRREAAAKCA